MEDRTEEQKTAERLLEFKKNMAVFFFEPYKWQRRVSPMLRAKNTVAIIASNKIGKSIESACIVISWVLGYEPWTGTHDAKAYEDAVEVGGVYYKPSSLGIKPPVDIVITGEDWKTHIGKTIVPTLKKMAPQGWYTTKKNEQGVEYFWEWNNKSTFNIMCYSQEDDLFESFRVQGAWEDEPPPKSKHAALSRGLLLDNGKTLMSLTPLKEAWILDDIVLSGRKDIGIIDGLCITDNEGLVADEKEKLTAMGLNDKQADEYFDRLLYSDAEKKLPVADKGRSAEYFVGQIAGEDNPKIARLKILKFIKDIDPVDVPPRIFGQFKSLVGRVLKEWDDKIHFIEPFEIPTDYVVTPMIDFHLSKPMAVSYWAVGRNDIHYCIKETWKNMSADEIADEIIRMLKNGWFIQDAFIDPLSKGDTSYMRNMVGTDRTDSFSTIHDKLSIHGITLHVASKDKDSGIKNIQTWLKGVNGLPTCYVFNTCERHRYEVHRWVFDDEGKPSKDSDEHFMENWYRYTLAGVGWRNYQIKPLPVHSRGFGFSEQANAWMAA